MLIAVVISSVASGGLITAVGYYNPFVLPSMVLFTVGSGMITTFSLDSPLRVWFGYQVIAGVLPRYPPPLFHFPSPPTNPLPS